MDKASIIRSCPIFAALDKKALSEISALAELEHVDKGEMIFSEGDEARAFFILAAGSVVLVKSTSEGREHFFRQVKKGEIFAEAAMLSGMEYPATATAEAASTLLTVRKEKFLAYLKAHPNAALAIMAAMAQLLRHMNNLISELSLSSVEARLASWLIRKSKEAGESKFDLGIQKRELAYRLGTVPETLSRNFVKLAKRGAIRMKGNEVEIRDPDSLADAAG